MTKSEEISTGSSEMLDIKKFSQLLVDNGLPEETPKHLVITLLQTLEDKNIDVNDAQKVEEVLIKSALWGWVQSQDIDLNEELPIEGFIQRVAALFGV